MNDLLKPDPIYDRYSYGAENLLPVLHRSSINFMAATSRPVVERELRKNYISILSDGFEGPRAIKVRAERHQRRCGGGGIRTHGDPKATAVFKTAAFVRSATPPSEKRQ